MLYADRHPWRRQKEAYVGIIKILVASSKMCLYDAYYMSRMQNPVAVIPNRGIPVFN